MKQIRLTASAAVLVAGCATAQQPEPPTAKAPAISIHDAVEKGNVEAIKQHLAAGTDVNAKDKDGFTPLIQAVQRGQKEVAKLLIEKGADVNAKTAKGGTPLDWANAGNHSETADLLRKHGAKTGAELKAKAK